MKAFLILVLIPCWCSGQVENLLYVTEDQGFVYVYDVNDNHKFLRKFEVPGTGEYKGVAADPNRGKLYLSSYVGDQLVCIDLKSETTDWSISIIGYPDSHAITPDGKFIYLPKRHGQGWDVIDTDRKEIITFIPVPYGNPHNTWCSQDGSKMYLSALGNENLYVADIKTHQIVKTVGPFESNPENGWGWTQKTAGGPKGIRPFAVGSDDKYCYVNLNGILGYEIGDLKTGKNGPGGS